MRTMQMMVLALAVAAGSAGAQQGTPKKGPKVGRMPAGVLARAVKTRAEMSARQADQAAALRAAKAKAQQAQAPR